MNMNLKLARIKKGLTQRQLGKMVGLSNVTISHIEKGYCDVTKSIMLKIAKALDATVQELFFDEEEWIKCQELINITQQWNL